MSAPNPAPRHTWKFVRISGLDQVSLETSADLLSLGELDPKLWVALGCPVKGLELDEKTLSLIDTDGDGRIRIPEVLAAVRWAGARLNEAADLLKGADSLPLAAVNGATPEGAAILATAKKILTQLGKPDADSVSLGDTGDPAKALGAAGLTGDGVVTPGAASSPETQALIADIIACKGGTAGAGGVAGITEDKAAAFFLEAEAFAKSREVQPSFLPFAPWTPAESSSPVQGLGIERVRAIIAGGGKAALAAVFSRDRELASDFKGVADLDRLVRYHRDLRALLHNFVNFADFYSPDHHAIFQSGVLYLDSRSCELCIRVDEPAAHSTLASTSNAYIAYLDCRRANGETMKVAACFTQGDSDYLFVGRNGMFFDRSGRDWDATIIRIVDNPISIRQAFFAPYKKFIRFVGMQIAKRAAAADSRSCLRATPSGPAEAQVRRRNRGGPGRRGGRHQRRVRQHPGGILRAWHLDAGGVLRRHSGDLRTLDDHCAPQAAPAQPRAPPGGERLGGEQPRENQYPARRLPDRPRGPSAGNEAPAEGSLQGQDGRPGEARRICPARAHRGRAVGGKDAS